MKKVCIIPNTAEDTFGLEVCNLANDMSLDYVGDDVHLVSAREQKAAHVFIDEDGEIMIDGCTWDISRQVKKVNEGGEIDGDEVDQLMAIYIDCPDDTRLEAEATTSDYEGEPVSQELITDSENQAVETPDNEETPDPDDDGTESDTPVLEVGDVIDVAQDGEDEDLREVMAINEDGSLELSDPDEGPQTDDTAMNDTEISSGVEKE